MASETLPEMMNRTKTPRPVTDLPRPEVTPAAKEYVNEVDSLRTILLELDNVLKSGDRQAILSRGLTLLANVRDHPLPNDKKLEMVNKISPYTVMFARAAKEMGITRGGASASGSSQEYDYVEQARYEYEDTMNHLNSLQSDSGSITAFAKSPFTKEGKRRFQAIRAKLRRKHKEKFKKWKNKIKEHFSKNGGKSSKSVLNDINRTEAEHKRLEAEARRLAEHYNKEAAKYPPNSLEYHKYKTLAEECMADAQVHKGHCAECCALRNEANRPPRPHEHNHEPDHKKPANANEPTPNAGENSHNHDVAKAHKGQEVKQEGTPTQTMQAGEQAVPNDISTMPTPSPLEQETKNASGDKKEEKASSNVLNTIASLEGVQLVKDTDEEAEQIAEEMIRKEQAGR